MKPLLDTYVCIVRGIIPGKKAKHVFITWSGKKLLSGGISTQLNSFFLKCLPDADDDERKISATLIRKSTDFFYEHQPEMKAELSRLMKHKQETAEKF